ncbi:MAG: hypothetical protein V2A73_05875, partial [Pseudomonadota bacterium]
PVDASKAADGPTAIDAAPIDAPLAVVDAAPLDAPPAVVDAAPGDGAGSDAGGSDIDAPPAEIVYDYQRADLVLGQDDFTSVAENQGNENPSASSLHTPTDVFFADGRFWVGDAENGRVLQWESVPTTRNQPADIVVGHVDKTSVAGWGQFSKTELTPSSLSIKVFVQGSRLWISHAMNRVVLWEPIPTTDGEEADLILGQTDDKGVTDWSSTSGHHTASKFDTPGEMWSDGAKFLLVDSLNCRVLIWNTIPAVDGAPADLLLGWPDFNMSPAQPGLEPPSASTLAGPYDLAYDDNLLYVVDSWNNRVMVWAEIPTQKGARADVVVGQTSFDVGEKNAGAGAPNAFGLDRPMGIAIGHDRVFVCDEENRRIVVFEKEKWGSDAVAVLGQPSLDQAAGELVPSDRTFKACRGMAVVGDKLWVADRYWNRVLRFQLYPKK